MAKKRIEKFDTARANSKEFTHFCGDCYDNNEIKQKINEIIDVLNKEKGSAKEER